MPLETPIDELLCVVASWDRDMLIQQFAATTSRFKIDFSESFYREQPIDRLRHIYVAMFLQNQRQPVAA